MIITSEYPYSSSEQHGAEGKWYPSAANYPACKLLLHADDYTSGNDWVDRMGGVIFRSSTGWTKDSIGMQPVAASIQTTIGALPAFGTKHFLMIVAGKFGTAASKTVIGDENVGRAISVSGAATGYITYDISANYLNSNVLVSTSPTYPTTGCMSLYGDVTNNEARKTYANSLGTEFASSVKNGVGSAGTIAQTWAALQPNFSFALSADNQKKMIALFAFTNPPSAAEIVIATRWMAANQGKLYPRWAGVS